MSQVREIVASVLGVAPAEIRESSAPRDFPQWDSAAHIDIMLSIEAAYGVSFAPEELVEAVSVGAMEEALRQRGVSPG